MVVEQAPADSIPAVDPIEAPSSISSFAPEGFVFQAPTGLSSFKFEPLTPRSADVFLTPRSVWFHSCLFIVFTEDIYDNITILKVLGGLNKPTMEFKAIGNRRFLPLEPIRNSV